MPDLKDNVAASLRELNRLHNSLPAGDEKTDVYNKILALARQDEALRKKTLDERMAEYKEAAKAVEEANKAIEDAQKKIGAVADVINKVASVIILVGKLLKAVGVAGT